MDEPKRGGRTRLVQGAAEGESPTPQFPRRVQGSVSSGGFQERFCFNHQLSLKSLYFINWYSLCLKSMLPFRAVAFLPDMQQSAAH